MKVQINVVLPEKDAEENRGLIKRAFHIWASEEKNLLKSENDFHVETLTNRALRIVKGNASG